MKKKLAAMIALLCVAASSQSAAAGDDVSLGLKLSTLGPGLEIQDKLTNYLGFRLGVNYLPFSASFTIEDVKYKTEFSWKSVSLLADLYPFGGIFRLTGGVCYNGNNVDISASPSESVTIGNNTYSPSDIGSLSGSVDFKKLVPYAGLGWSGGRASSGEWTFSFDLGVLFQGAPSVNNLTASGLLGSDPAFNADLDIERDKIKDKMDPYQYYPVVALALAYHF
jgi:hypothetical protein